MDLRRLRAGEWIAALGGLALVASLVLPWYKRGPVACIAVVGADCPEPESFTGWEAFSLVDIVLAVVGGFAVAMFVITLTQPTPAMAIATDALLALLGVVATLLVVIRLADLPDLANDLSRSVGAWIALAAAFATAVGAWLAMRDERRSGPGQFTDLTGRPAPPRPEPDPLPPPEPAR
jgi:uncharacterized membrane protein YfcA